MQRLYISAVLVVHTVSPNWNWVCVCRISLVNSKTTRRTYIHKQKNTQDDGRRRWKHVYRLCSWMFFISNHWFSLYILSSFSLIGTSSSSFWPAIEKYYYVFLLSSCAHLLKHTLYLRPCAITPHARKKFPSKNFSFFFCCSKRRANLFMRAHIFYFMWRAATIHFRFLSFISQTYIPNYHRQCAQWILKKHY